MDSNVLAKISLEPRPMDMAQSIFLMSIASFFTTIALLTRVVVGANGADGLDRALCIGIVAISSSSFRCCTILIMAE